MGKTHTQASQTSVTLDAGALVALERGNPRMIALLQLLAARACGELCAATGTSDVIDASVVITARQLGDAIVSSDVDDLRHLDPSAVIDRI